MARFANHLFLVTLAAVVLAASLCMRTKYKCRPARSSFHLAFLITSAVTDDPSCGRRCQRARRHAGGINQVSRLEEAEGRGCGDGTHRSRFTHEGRNTDSARQQGDWPRDGSEGPFQGRSAIGPGNSLRQDQSAGRERPGYQGRDTGSGPESERRPAKHRRNRFDWSRYDGRT